MATIRHALQSDVPTILKLIHELAEYEHEASSVEATEESLLATLAFADSTAPPLSRSRPARALLLFTPAGTAAGLALYFYNYSTWRSLHGIYLEDLYVSKSERGKGYGKLLIGTLAKEVKETGGGRLEWSVLKWNVDAIGFYERLGAVAMEGWTVMRVEGEKLGALAVSGVEVQK